MPIDFSCGACGQVYRVKDEFAGRTTKCRKCSQPVTVPQPTPVEPTSELGSWMEDELGAIAPAPPAVTASAGSTPCPGCGAPLSPDAILCVRCGYDAAIGQKRATQRPDVAASRKSRSAASGQLWSLGKGIALSGAGALLGAIVWAMVAVVTDRQIGWVAWGVGAAAGGGMSLGYDDKSEDGMLPGVLAAFMALGGIVLGKILILVWVLYPLLTGEFEDFAFKREIVASQMASTALEKRGLDPETNDAAYDKEFRTSLQSLATLSDEEIDQRFERIMNEVSQKAEVAVNAQVANAEQPAQPEVIQFKLDEDWAAAQQAEEANEPSLISAFFSAMFGPMDAIFILLAFFTAYKVGSGGSTD